MRVALDLSIVLGFLVIDALLFHDILKPGEHYTPVEYMTGIVSAATMQFLSTDILGRLRLPVRR